MKITANIILCFFMACLFTACANGVDDYIAEATLVREQQSVDTTKVLPTYPTFDSPVWGDSLVTSYQNTMTAFVVLPDSLIGPTSSADEMAVKNGNTVCGILKYTWLADSKSIWMGLVYGNLDGEQLTIQYYSGNSKHKYYSAPFSFTADGQYGTIDNPETLSMTIVTKK